MNKCFLGKFIIPSLFLTILSLNSFSMEEIKDDTLLGNDTVSSDVLSVITSFLQGRDLLNLGLASHCHLENVAVRLATEKSFSRFVFTNVMKQIFNACEHYCDLNNPNGSKQLFAEKNHKIIAWDITSMLNSRKAEVGSSGFWKAFIVEFSRQENDQIEFSLMYVPVSKIETVGDGANFNLIRLVFDNPIITAPCRGCLSSGLDLMGSLSFAKINLRNGTDLDRASLIHFLDNHSSRNYQFSANAHDYN